MRRQMQFQERSGVMRGRLELVLRRNGKVVEHDPGDNLIVNVARMNMARLLSGEGQNKVVNRVAVGTNGAAPTPDDTVITSAYMKPISGFVYPTPTSVRFDFIILENEANGMSIVEFGLVAADGSLVARRTRGGKRIEKEDDLEIEGYWTILF